MKKNLTKVALLVALTAPLSMNLASCTKPDPNPDKFDCREEAKKAAKEGRKLIVLDFWHAFNNVNEAAARIINDRFNTEHIKPADGSTGICVQMTSYGDYNTLQTQVNSAISSNTLPQIVSSYPDHLASYNTYGVVVDMNKFQNDESLKIKDFEDFLVSYQKESYNYIFDKATYDRFVEEEKTQPFGKGNLFSLPVNKSTEVMYYNKTFFDIFTPVEGGGVAGDLSKAHLKSGETADKAPAAGAFDKNTTITVNWKDKEYTGQPWALKSSDGSTIALKHPGKVDPKRPDTWLTWDDVELNGVIIQQISKNFRDILTGQVYNSIIQNGDQFAQKIKENGSYSMSWDSVSNLFITLANSLNNYSQVVPVDPSDDQSKMKADLLFTDPTVINEFKELRRLFEQGIFTVPLLIGDQSSKYGTNAFVAQSIFMSVGSTAGAALNNSGDFEVGVTAPPVLNNETEYNEDGSVKTTKAKVISQGTNVSILSYKDYAKLTAKDIEGLPETDPKVKAYNQQIAAREYLKYITDTEQNLTFATNTTYFPTRQSVLDNEEFKKYMSDKIANPALKAEAVAVQVGLDLSVSGAFFTDRPFPGSAALRTDIENIFNNILNSKDSVDKVITDFYNVQITKVEPF